MARHDELSRNAITNMRRLRKLHRLTTEELAQKLRDLGDPVTANSIALQESRRSSRMPVGQAVLLCRLFNISIEELVDSKPCERCGGSPPAGFACTECGKTGQVNAGA